MMSLSTALFSGWRHLRAAFQVSGHQTLREILCAAYHAEANAVVQCTQQADQMCYPQFRAELLRIAAEMQAHLPWLHQQIFALGGGLPSSSPRPPSARNSWECFRHDMEEARRGSLQLLEWTHRVERAEPDIAVGLQRIRQDKMRHREEFRQMFMKSDPYTSSTTGSPQPHEARQQQAWLEQRKNEWLDHERVAWEGGGKQPPWAEWAGEQEFKWATELPHHDREWAHHLAEQRDADMHRVTP